MIGATIGHYEIVELLGQGGMGKVFRARDTRLDREVAVKVLPDDFAADSERVARFDREARLLASLNHSHIAAIYGLEDFEDQHFIVMELVDGESLAERIARLGGVGVETALSIARQTAEALEAAHGSGIIHRDLKPANIMVTPDDEVKVLDFGLAKAFELEASGEQDLTHSPTITMGATRTGIILGTASYMSPEQAKGQRLDKRTDIFSFGCVIFEMLAGCKPFLGEDVSETLASILREEPNWSLLPSSTPPALSRLLRRCLEKNRDRRLHDVADARIEIEEILEQPPDRVDPASETPARRTRVPAAVPWAVAVVMAIVAAWSAWGPPSRRADRAGSVPVPVSRLTIETEPLLTQERVPALAVSTDGSRVVYSASDGETRRLFLRRLDSLDATPIAGSEGAVGPFLSPDGSRVGFAAEGELRTVSVEGGPATTVQPVSVFLGGHWGEDESLVYGEWPTRNLWHLPTGGGAARSLTDGLMDRSYYIAVAPSFVPGSQAVVFNSFSSFTGPHQPMVRMSSVDSGRQTTLELAGTNVHYLPTGHLVFAGGGSLLAAPFDAETLELRGAPVAVLADVLTNVHGAAQYDISSNGTLVYVRGGEELPERRLVWVDRTGSSSLVVDEIRPFWGPRLSVEGDRLSTWIASDPAGVWIHDIARGGMTRLTPETSAGFWSLWSSDGERLAFIVRDESGSHEVGWRLIDRAAPFETLVDPEKGWGQPLSWGRDGATLIFQQSSGDTGFDLWQQSLDGESDPQPLVRTSANEFQGILSPDGDWLAYVTDESGRREVYVKSYPDAAKTLPISTRGGQEPLWGPGGRELFYRSDGRVMVVDIESEPEFAAGRPRVLFEDRFVPGTPYGRNWDVHPDGERFVMVESAAPATGANEIVVVQNWFEELQRLVPTGP